MYRDAGNFKAFGTVSLDGELGKAEKELIRERLAGREFFIAEQVRVQPLYRELYNGAAAQRSMITAGTSSSAFVLSVSQRMSCKR
jgi:hypothetical protein